MIEPHPTRAPRRANAYLTGMKLLMSGWMLVAGIDTHSQALLKPLISYQGVLKDGMGNAVPAGNKNIIFRIYDESGTLLWAESQSVAIDANGLFNVALGSGMRTQDVLPPSVTDLSKVFTQIGSSPLDQRYLELQVDDGSLAIAPRQQFLAAPYAFGVANIDHAEGPFLVDGILTASSDADVKGGLKVEQTATVGVLQLPAPPGGDPFKISPGTSSPVTAYMDIGDGPGWVMHMRGTGSNVISFANDGRIGIKQPSPAVELDVNGTIQATNLVFKGTKPFMVRSYKFFTDITSHDTGVATNAYVAVVGGFNAVGQYFSDSTDDPKNTAILAFQAYANTTTGTWYVQANAVLHGYSNSRIEVVFIRRDWVDDQRTP